jgi:hypothetical protein
VWRKWLHILRIFASRERLENSCSFRSGHNSLLLPNVKDEPRRHLARRVPDSDQHSNVSIRSFVRMHAA